MTRLFGTDGVRGIVGELMTVDLAMRLGKALGTHLKVGQTVALGMDARTSGPMLAAAVTAGVLSTGVNVLRLGVSPTPAIQLYAARHEEVAAALIVTASHNPAPWNGIKYIAKDGTEASREDEEAVEALYASQKFRAADWKGVGRLTNEERANDEYVEAVLAQVDAGSIRKRRFKVVVDPAGGPGTLTTPRILRELGCDVVLFHGELDGSFGGRSPEPVEENLAKLKAKVAEAKADLGLAHDGDADRCVFVDEAGKFVPGEQSFALLAGHMLDRTGGGVLCTPVSTGSVVEAVAKAHKGRVLYTAVGSPIVGRQMRLEKAAFGGEENGGLIFPEHQYCRDALLTAARMLEFLAKQKKPLGELRRALPVFHVTKSKFECPDAHKEHLIEAVKAWVRANWKTARIDETDGIKIYLPDGWILARPSGTEPIFRVYAESKDPARSKALADEFVDRSKRLLAELEAPTARAARRRAP